MHMGRKNSPECAATILQYQVIFWVVYFVNIQ